MSYNKLEKSDMRKDYYPKTKIILPFHLREEVKKQKVILNNNNKNKSDNIKYEVEKNRINNFLDLYNIQDK